MGQCENKQNPKNINGQQRNEISELAAITGKKGKEIKALGSGQSGLASCPH